MCKVIREAGITLRPRQEQVSVRVRDRRLLLDRLAVASVDLERPLVLVLHRLCLVENPVSRVVVVLTAVRAARHRPEEGQGVAAGAVHVGRVVVDEAGIHEKLRATYDDHPLGELNVHLEDVPVRHYAHLRLGPHIDDLRRSRVDDDVACKRKAALFGGVRQVEVGVCDQVRGIPLNGVIRRAVLLVGVQRKRVRMGVVEVGRSLTLTNDVAENCDVGRSDLRHRVGTARKIDARTVAIFDAKTGGVVIRVGVKRDNKSVPVAPGKLHDTRYANLGECRDREQLLAHAVHDAVGSVPIDTARRPAVVRELELARHDLSRGSHSNIDDLTQATGNVKGVRVARACRVQLEFGLASDYHRMAPFNLNVYVLAHANRAVRVRSRHRHDLRCHGAVQQDRHRRTSCISDAQVVERARQLQGGRDRRVWLVEADAAAVRVERVKVGHGEVAGFVRRRHGKFEAESARHVTAHQMRLDPRVWRDLVLLIRRYRRHRRRHELLGRKLNVIDRNVATPSILRCRRSGAEKADVIVRATERDRRCLPRIALVAVRFPDGIPAGAVIRAADV
mmetsp:Transcript_75826/g.216172  ORF Transcript_75826/g.216172 Transcript_75826/m.216172 type:complete len:562 (-) Transcript_75826:8913-10598(-)